MKKTSIIILSYNTREYTQACIENIRRFTPAGSYEIIVVDNASQDDSVTWLQAQNDLKLILNTENKGFPVGCNQGMAIAEAGNDLLLLNSDTIVTPRWLENMQRALYSDDGVGAVGCVTNYSCNEQNIDIPFEIKDIADLDEMLAFAADYNHSDANKWIPKWKLVGFCLLIRREIYQQIGGLDERFTPGNYEDDDYSLRIWQTGHRLLLCTDTYIHHFGGVSFWRKKTEKEKAEHRKRYNSLLRSHYKKLAEKWNIHDELEVYNAYQARDIAEVFANMGDNFAADNMLTVFHIKRRDKKGYPAANLIQAYQAARDAYDIEGQVACMAEVVDFLETEPARERYAALQFFDPLMKILLLAALDSISRKQGQLGEFYLSFFPEEMLGELSFLPSYRYWQGLACYEQGKWQQAVSWLKAQVQNEPQDEAAWFYLGNAYYKLHDDVNALQMYQKALECQKSLAEAKVNMASVWQRLQEQETAALLRQQVDSSLLAAAEQEGIIEYLRDDDLAYYVDHPEEAYQLPVFINSRDRLGCLQRLVSWLLAAGYQNIYILDNDSSYEPLLKYYEEVQDNGVQVIYLRKNIGHKALWQANILEIMNVSTPYVYTDSDVLPGEECPVDVLYTLAKALQKFPFAQKAGLSLRLDDITFYDKEYIRKIENVYWRFPIGEDEYYAAVDTTLALYRNRHHYTLAEGVRLGGKYQARHLPWYYDYENLPADEEYYMKHAGQWSSLLNRMRKEGKQ